MIINITDEYRVKTIPMNFVLEQYREIKPRNKPVRYEWVFLGYYSGLASALKALPDHVALAEGLIDVGHLSARLRDIAEDAAKRLLR